MTEAPHRLSTARLVGARITAADLDDFRSYYGDPDVMKFLDPEGDPWGPEAVESLLRGHLDHWTEHGFGTWVFREPEAGRFIGRAGLRSVDLGNGPEVELFYGVASDRWGEGFATEMAVEITRTAFSSMNVPALVAFTLPSNLASRRVLEKLNFRADGEIVHAGLRHLLYRRPGDASATP